VKDNAAWNGAELTDTTRARFRKFVAKFSLPAHGAFPIIVDEIVDAAPVAVQRPVPRPYGRVRSQ
jgi:hypothetical protein